MCGRYVIDDGDDIIEMKRILDTLKKHYSDTYEYQELHTGEIFPNNMVPVIIPDKAESIDVVPMKWGFENSQKKNLIINSRCEGILERPMFKDSIKNKRCIIPTNGFFEFRTMPDNRKECYFIRRSNGPMLYLAGIYNDFASEKALKRNVRFTIITRQAYGVISTIHDRMPVHVEKRDIYKWLNGRENNMEEIFTSKVPEYNFINAG